VVLIVGSGPNDRDESILGHKPFLVLADYLTRHGIAVLRYDKRGSGNRRASTRRQPAPTLPRTLRRRWIPCWRDRTSTTAGSG